MRKPAVAVLAVLLMGAAVYVLRHRAPVATIEKTRPLNLILISIDTVRTDFLQLYNSAGAPTPSLMRMSRRGFVFRNAIAQAPVTLPSHCTMLTGTYPMFHRVRENTTARLADSSLTLAEVLRTRGYQTAGFVGSLVLESGTGIEQGFDTFDDSFTSQDTSFEDRGGVQKSAAAVKRSFMRWLESQSRSPFFAFLHFYDPHAPYEPPPQFAPRVRTPQDLYRGELQYVDSVIGEIYDEMMRRGLIENTVVVVTGDHGEMFGEHQEEGHGYFVYRPAVRIPLMILAPARWQGVSDDVVELVDVMPTILDLLDVPIPGQAQGRSVASALRGETLPGRAAYSESFASALHFGTLPLRSLQNAEYQYIDSPQPELYDLRNDPQEANNIWSSKPQVASRMKLELQKAVKETEHNSGETNPRELSSEEREQLSALGYITPSAGAPNSKDPKAFIGLWQDLNRLSGMVKQPDCSECLLMIERMKKQGPLPLQALVFEARALTGFKRYADAISIAQTVLLAEPANTQALMILAHCHKRTGHMEKALSIYRSLMDRPEESVLGLQHFAQLMIRMNRGAELARAIDEMEAAGNIREKHYPILAEVFIMTGETTKAHEYAAKAVETSPDNPAGYIHLSTVLDLQGKTGEALELLETHRERFPTADYLFQTGRLYGKSGFSAREYDVFQDLVRLHPNDARGYFFLGKCELERSNPSRVIELAQSGLSLNEDPELESFGYLLLGDAYKALGNAPKASQYLEQAKTLQQKRPMNQ
jgi:arylsulfatase A-like enzyme/predicted Zn-dependent protease